MFRSLHAYLRRLRPRVPLPCAHRHRRAPWCLIDRLTCRRTGLSCDESSHDCRVRGNWYLVQECCTKGRAGCRAQDLRRRQSRCSPASLPSSAAVVDAELGHQLRAIRLDGAQADPKFVGDLLVELAGNNAVEDLALARRKHRQARACRRRRLRAPRAASASRASARWIASSNASRPTGFSRKSTAPAFIARTLVDTSAWPVRKMTGIATPCRCSAACRSRPDGPGRRTSSSTQPGRSGSGSQQEFAGRGVAARFKAGGVEQVEQRSAQRLVVVDDVDQRSWCFISSSSRMVCPDTRGQLDMEAMPRLHAVLGPDAATVCLDDGARDRQAEPHATLLGAEERIEKLGQVARARCHARDRAR